MELVTVRLPGFGSGAGFGSCAAAGRTIRTETAATTSGRHTYFDTKGFENIDPPIGNDARERGWASAPVARRTSKMDATARAGSGVRRRRFAQEKRKTTAGASAPIEQKCVARRKRRQRCWRRRGDRSATLAAHIAARRPRTRDAAVRTYSSTIASKRT